MKFENPQMYSSFGKMYTSDRLQAPRFGFGTAERQARSKLYQNKDIAKVDCTGKVSPGPAYNVRGSD